MKSLPRILKETRIFLLSPICLVLNHKWSCWYKNCAGGYFRECLRCGKTEVKKDEEEMTREEASEIVKGAAGRRPDFPSGKDYVDEVRGHRQGD